MEQEIDWKGIKEISDEKQFREKIKFLTFFGVLSSKQENNYEVFSKDGKSLNPEGVYFASGEEAKRYGESFGIPTTLFHHSPRFSGNLEQRAEKAREEKIEKPKEYYQENEEKRIKRYRIKEIIKGVIGSPLIFYAGGNALLDICYKLGLREELITFAETHDMGNSPGDVMVPPFLLASSLYFGKKVYNAIKARYMVQNGKDRSSFIKKAIATAAVLSCLLYGANKTGLTDKAKQFVQNKKEYISSRETSKTKSQKTKEKKGGIEKELKKVEGMAYIPPGEFIMGSDLGSDSPPHKVYLDGYYIDKYEVTFDEYDRFCEATGRNKPSDKGEGRGNLPVIRVSWEDATAYAEWLGKRLPTEAEWEKACRGGSTGEWCFGNDKSKLEDYAWIDEPTKENPLGKFLPVGTKKPNVYGIYDMHGNVWEWCADWYDENYYKKSPYKNPKGPETGKRKVIRGASWDYIFVFKGYSYYRSHYPPDSNFFFTGFRCAYSSDLLNEENVQLTEKREYAPPSEDPQTKANRVAREFLNKTFPVQRNDSSNQGEHTLPKTKIGEWAETKGKPFVSKIMQWTGQQWRFEEKNKEEVVEEKRVTGEEEREVNERRQERANEIMWEVRTLLLEQKNLNNVNLGSAYKGAPKDCTHDMHVSPIANRKDEINRRLKELRNENYNAYERGEELYNRDKNLWGN